jgi:glucose uptake protein
MFVPNSFGVALAVLLVGMMCWGSWANAYKITPDRRFELFYWDYVIGIFLTAIVGALTLGSMFGGPTALQNLLAASRESILYALLAGVVLNCGNVLLTAALSLVGMTVAFPIAQGLSIVVGTIISYLITPKGNPIYLFVGVGLVLAAVMLSSLAYRAREANSVKPSKKGFFLAVLSGILFCGFGPLVTKAFACAKPVDPYGAAVLFTAGAFLSTFPLMGYFMRFPVKGAPISAAEFWRSSKKEHLTGLLGGFIWGAGTVFTFTAANYVGMALAGAIGQANSVIAASWGVFVWLEFRGASVRVRLLLVAMFAFYIGGILSMLFSHM